MKYNCDNCNETFTTKILLTNHKKSCMKDNKDNKDKVLETTPSTNFQMIESNMINMMNIEKIMRQGLNTTEKDILDANIIKLIGEKYIDKRQSNDRVIWTIGDKTYIYKESKWIENNDIIKTIVSSVINQILEIVMKMKDICMGILTINVKKMEQYKSFDRTYTIGGIRVVQRMKELLEQYYTYKQEYLENIADIKQKYLAPETDAEEMKENRDIVKYMDTRENFTEFYDANDYGNIMRGLERCVMIYNFIMCRFECQDYQNKMVCRVCELMQHKK